MVEKSTFRISKIIDKKKSNRMASISKTQEYHFGYKVDQLQMNDFCFMVKILASNQSCREISIFKTKTDYINFMIIFISYELKSGYVIINLWCNSFQ